MDTLEALDSAVAVSQHRAYKLYAPDFSHAVHKRILEHHETADTLTALRDRLASGIKVRLSGASHPESRPRHGRRRT